MSITVIDPFSVAADAAMPFLARALNPVEVQHQFACHLSRLTGGKDTVALRTIRVTRYKPGRRCLIEYEVEVKRPGDSSTSITIVGKGRAKGLDQASYELLESLWNAGFGADSEDGISVPEPLGVIPELQMWFQRKVPGLAATQLLAAADGVALARRIAEAVYKLQQAGIPPYRRHTMADELRILHKCLPLVAQMKPQWANRLDRVLAACDRLGAATPAPQCKGIHRDFYADQVIVDGARLYLVDFDLYCEGDPGLDVGNFLGHLTEQSVRTLGDADALVDREQAMEERFVALCGESVRASVRAYATLTLVRHIYLSTQFAERRPFTQALLTLCEERLGLKGHAHAGKPAHKRDDPELPFLEMAWSPGQMQEFLNRQVLPAVWPGQEVTAVAIDEMTYKPGKQCEILYSLQFADPTRGQSRWAGVTFANENKLGEIYRHHYGREGAAQPLSCPVVFLPEYECLVEFFPRDWQLPFLARAMEPGEVASLLPACPADAGRAEGGAEAERSRGLSQIEVLHYRPHSRCALRYVLDAPEGSDPQEVIGKVFVSGPLAVQGAHTLNSLYAQAMAWGLIIPKPLRVVPEWGLLLMERVPGTGLRPVVRRARAPQQLREVIGLAAAALASLHRLRFESQQVQSLQTQVEKLRRRAASLHLVAPLLAQQVDALLQQIAQSGSQCAAVAYSLVHGDFSPGQLLVEKDQMAVIDFDSASLGDPALDVGNFMASLHHRAASRANNAFRQLATHFLSEYQARLPEQRVAERIHLFLSAALIRKALREFERWPYKYGQAGPNSSPVRLLQEAAACLEHY